MKSLLLSIIAFVLITAAVFFTMKSVYNSNAYQADNTYIQR